MLCGSFHSSKAGLHNARLQRFRAREILDASTCELQGDRLKCARIAEAASNRSPLFCQRATYLEASDDRSHTAVHCILTRGCALRLPTSSHSPRLRELAIGGFVIALAVRSADFHLGLLLVMVFSIWMWPAAAWAYTAEEQAACSDDAFRLCSAEIPDVDRVTACMVRRQSQLSPGCRVYFGPDPPDPPAASQKPLKIKPAHARKPRKPKKTRLTTSRLGSARRDCFV